MSSQFDANSNETLLSTSTSFLLDSSSFWLLFRIKLLILIPCVLACIILFLLIFYLLKYFIGYCRKSRQKLTINHRQKTNDK
ncbi:unnamed protein product [Rotaria magnacalcarata]|uniref:Uncharacterized protein n=1 Tax=Rotaria magnacalcarata TaxID=392030 RepID=A0A816ALN1_9BILA|nr:unnamed protein product [Rotaria magnacalcarata]